jgi:hypothetical protein
MRRRHKAPCHIIVCADQVHLIRASGADTVVQSFADVRAAFVAAIVDGLYVTRIDNLSATKDAHRQLLEPRMTAQRRYLDAL